MSPALVIFDLDGVLVDSELIAARAVAEVLSEHGAPLTTEEVVGRFAGLTDREIASVVERETGRRLPGNFDELADRRTMALFDGVLTAVPGAAETLPHIHVPICVASNSPPERVSRSLATVGLDRFFTDQTLFSALTVERPKPAPDIYLHAADRMTVAVQDCLVVEDSPTGVRAAVAAGMTVLGFVGAGHIADREAHGAGLRAEGASAILTVFAELKGYLPGR